jgi:adenylate kinase
MRNVIRSFSIFGGSKFYKKPMFVLLGAPGVGKGTYGKRLSKDWNMPIFSTGEYLRALLKTDKTELGNKIRELVQAGKLVGDDIIMEIMERRLFKDEDKKAKGILLDGFPRTVKQAEMLEKLGKVSAAMNFFLRDDILIEKLAGRRECDKCHIPYNVATIKRDGYDMEPLLPKKDVNTCDACGGKLIQREDDTEKVIKDRLGVYKSKTFPLEEYYKKKGIFIEYEPKRGVTDYPDIKLKFTEYLKAKKIF